MVVSSWTWSRDRARGRNLIMVVTSCLYSRVPGREVVVVVIVVTSRSKR